jgi:RNA polymerase sigma factor for flagellar operon FliA
VGVLGLVHASRGFRPDQGSSFATYATTRIRGAVLDELRRMDWLPRRSRTKAKQLKSVISEVEQRLGRVATEVEVAEAMSLSAEEYADLLDEVRPISCLELDAPGSDEESDGSTLHELVADLAQGTAYDEVEKREVIAMMSARIQQMPEMQRKVLAFYYYEEMRLAEIAEIFHVTESRICQIHSQAIFSLRSYLTSALER